MDDPWIWDVDRVVRELCFLDRSWITIPFPELPPSDQLEASLREQGVDGHTLLTYPEETELCDMLRIKTLKNKHTFMHARTQLRARSQTYQYQYTSTPATTTTLAREPDGILFSSNKTPSGKTRRVAPTLLSSAEDRIKSLHISAAPTTASLGGARPVTTIDHVYTAATSKDKPPLYDQNEMNFVQTDIPPWKSRQANRLWKRYVRRDQLGHMVKRKADMVASDYNSAHDVILPLYGESDSDADSETWREVQKEHNDLAYNSKNDRLSNDVVNRVIDEAIQGFVDEWRQRKLPALSHQAHIIWKHAIQCGQQSAINIVRDKVRSLEDRRAKLYEGILCQKWQSVSKLQSIIRTLEPTIVDQQAMQWRLGILNSTREPRKVLELPRSRKLKARSSKPRDDEESGETISSESETSDRDDRKQSPCESRSSQAGSVRSLEITNVVIGKSKTRDKRSDRDILYSTPSVELGNSTSLHATKRKNEEAYGQPSAKRRVPTDIIEISDSEDDDQPQRSDEQQEPENSVSNKQDSREVDYEFGGQYANRHITEEEWKRVCKMFRCPVSTIRLKPQGFSIEIAAYQLHAIWWLLTQKPLRDIQGGCLGDSMGLGKTIEVLSTFAVFAMIKANHAEVTRFWKEGVMTGNRQHLPREQVDSTIQCPSQNVSPYPTECTCVRSGDPFKIARYMPSLPTICVVPPTAMRFWAAEFRKVVDPLHTVARALRISVWHNDYAKNEQLYHGQNRVLATAGAAVQQVDAEGETRTLVGGRPGLSNWLLIVSRHNTTKFYALYNKMSSRLSDQNGRDKDVVMNLMGASFLFFDEAHQYNGTLDSPTDPFRFLQSLRDTSQKEPVAVTVSASIPLSGPIHLANIVEHVLVSKYLQGHKPKIGSFDNAHLLKGFQTEYQYIIENLGRGRDEKAQEKIQTRRQSLNTLMKELVPRLLMARRPTDTFRGKMIGDGGQEIIVKHINCPMKDGPARDAFRRMIAEVHTYVQRLLHEEKQEWTHDGQVGPEPTQQSVEAGLFASGEDNNVVARMSRASQKMWIRLTRASVYPFLAYLLETDQIKDTDLHYDTVNQLGALSCKTLFTQGLNDAVRAFEQSSLWPHRRELSRQSPKFDQLCHFVEEMLAYRLQTPTADNPGPRDGTNIRHMIVLTQSPASAFVTYMLLSRVYVNNVKVVLVNAVTKNEASANDGGYGRNQIFDDLNSPCNESSPNMIIVSTYRICGVALNLQRANYCVMMEPAGITDTEKQAAARVNRRGQDMKPVTVMLYDEHNFAECLRLSRRANHEEMLSWKENGIPWDNFV